MYGSLCSFEEGPRQSQSRPADSGAGPSALLPLVDLFVSGERASRLKNAYARPEPRFSRTGPRRYSMADGDRGEMFAELERACDELDRALEQLKKAGYTLREFSKGLETDPTGILLTHYPNGYMIYPDEINKTPWEYPALRPIVDLDYLIELLKRARQLKRAKMDIERRLGKKLTPVA